VRDGSEEGCDVLTDRLTESASAVVSTARLLAALGGREVEPADLMDALLSHPGCDGAAVLEAVGAGDRAAVPPAPPESTVVAPLGPATVRVLTLALNESDRLGQNYIDTGHLALALIEVGQAPGDLHLARRDLIRRFGG
jgi:hypothetical protein